ncbi:MAG: hypothetical protein KC620_23195, partial [Myxococcales bacterium]|nr:hypothetical protein [Myxococcales bacterium]
YQLGNQPVAGILANCPGEVMMLACRRDGAPNFQVAAMGLRDEVLTPAGNVADAVHEHNGVARYFADTWSWCFVPGGALPNRNSCDTAGQAPDATATQRLCWHTSGGNLNAGWRCGSDTAIGNGFERLILVADRFAAPVCNAVPGEPLPEVCGPDDDDCDGLIDEGLVCPAP